jgi:hypothetical protein
LTPEPGPFERLARSTADGFGTVMP